MRIAVVFIPDRSREKLLNIAKGLARGIEQQGHQVDLVDGSRDVNTKLTIYEYICVGTEPTSVFGGKIPTRATEFLSNSGMIASKRSFAFVIKRGLSTMKALSRLMKSMEREGMFLKFSDILLSPEEAQEIGKRLKIK
jgi:menaquinone-dependent protoporphyrinogen IX oxidase